MDGSPHDWFKERGRGDAIYVRHRGRRKAESGCDPLVAVLRGRPAAVGSACWREGGAAVPVSDEKDVRELVDTATVAQAVRQDWKPAPGHPWRRPFKAPGRAAT